ncbi:uncharacterized protein MELLADRAFT_110125 [Melampsora larici-populina 98AG31]|uniref:Uncharacterized protein n=1 Tax=Melampsora larici-populina (strain 98AG31 / pathotype 3-4-7) TaxID=747676 RepID=F4RYR6_MELLP|nr:uncharacterized protein MELLADRAFT_110125 [Melampsora larici-populina 98AG31]EGG02517.1 hypothetical protein MELLADRAFT_110125 [Melampsora larici-populina 98AG31]
MSLSDPGYLLEIEREKLKCSDVVFSIGARRRIATQHSKEQQEAKVLEQHSTFSILGHYETLVKKTYPTDPPYLPKNLFSREDAWQITKNYTSVSNGAFLREILGGQTIPGLFETITTGINSWLHSNSYKQHQADLEDIQISIDQEFLDTELIEKEHEEESRLKAVARDLKAQGIADRKRLRTEKASQALKLKEQKQADKNKQIVHFTSTSG